MLHALPHLHSSNAAAMQNTQTPTGLVAARAQAGIQMAGAGLPNGSIRCTCKDPVAACAKAQNVSCEELDLSDLAWYRPRHVPLAEDITAATARHAQFSAKLEAGKAMQTTF